MYIVTKQVGYGKVIVEALKEEVNSFEEAKALYNKHIHSITSYKELFNEEGELSKLKRAIFDYGHLESFSKAFYESIHSYIHGKNIESIKPIDIPDDSLYTPGCEDEMNDDDYDDDEAELHANFFGLNKNYLKAIDNENLYVGPCGCDGFYIYELAKTNDGELFAYMCPIDHEKEVYATTGIIKCNSIIMNNDKKNYLFGIVEMSNNEANFSVHEEGPMSIKIKLEYIAC